jgi:hypothetical protein
MIGEPPIGIAAKLYPFDLLLRAVPIFPYFESFYQRDSASLQYGTDPAIHISCPSVLPTSLCARQMG